MNILDKIVQTKRKEVELAKKSVRIEQLTKEPLFLRQTASLKTRLKNAEKPGIITEFKRKSPSKGLINGHVTVENVTYGYTQAGAAALSVLTDADYFGGSTEDFLQARARNKAIPMLRKDFIVDEYQLYQTKAMGADIVLIIAACLSPLEVRQLSLKARELGLEVLLEVHDKNELLDTMGEHVDMIGVNNRNLKTFETSIETSVSLSGLIPDSFVKISESGLKDAETIYTLYESGYKGFLMGETFMKTAEPATAFESLQNDIKRIINLKPIRI